MGEVLHEGGIPMANCIICWKPLVDDNGMPLPYEEKDGVRTMECPHCRKKLIFARKLSSKGIQGPWEPVGAEEESRKHPPSLKR